MDSRKLERIVLIILALLNVFLLTVVLSDNVQSRRSEAETAGAHLANAFDFCRKAFAGGQELLIFVTELSVNPHTAAFIARHGSADYAAHSKELLFYERHREIDAALAALDGEA